MSDRLDKFLTTLADNVGANAFRAYHSDPADVDLSIFKAGLITIYRHADEGLLQTGRIQTAAYLPHNPINMIEVALTPEGVERWRSP